MLVPFVTPTCAPATPPHFARTAEKCCLGRPARHYKKWRRDGEQGAKERRTVRSFSFFPFCMKESSYLPPARRRRRISSTIPPTLFSSQQEAAANRLLLSRKQQPISIRTTSIMSLDSFVDILAPLFGFRGRIGTLSGGRKPTQVDMPSLDDDNVVIDDNMNNDNNDNNNLLPKKTWLTPCKPHEARLTIVQITDVCKYIYLLFLRMNGSFFDDVVLCFPLRHSFFYYIIFSHIICIRTHTHYKHCRHLGTFSITQNTHCRNSGRPRTRWTPQQGGDDADG